MLIVWSCLTKFRFRSYNRALRIQPVSIVWSFGGIRGYCQNKDLLIRSALINDRIQIVEGELVSCGPAYGLLLGDVVLRELMRRWALLVLSFVGAFGALVLARGRRT
jgi:hypothetical protein